MQIAVLGSDLGKNSCNPMGLDGQGTVVKRRLRLLTILMSIELVDHVCGTIVRNAFGAGRFKRQDRLRA